MRTHSYIRRLVVILLLLFVWSWSGSTQVQAGGGECTSNSDCADASNLSCDCVGSACGWIDTFCSIPPGGTEGTCSSTCRHTGGVSCFPAGTTVKLASGEDRDIAHVVVGDRVVSQSEMGERAVSRVTAIETPVRDHMCTVKFAGGGSLRMTDEHPVFTQEGWKSIVPENTAKENTGLGVEHNSPV